MSRLKQLMLILGSKASGKDPAIGYVCALKSEVSDLCPHCHVTSLVEWLKLVSTADELFCGTWIIQISMDHKQFEVSNN